MSVSNVLVISASSDIGSHLVEHYLRQGFTVSGTYRTRTSRVADLERAGAKLFQLNIRSNEHVKLFAEHLANDRFEWDTLISAPGVLDPIGSFFSSDFEAWEDSVITNSTAQLRVLHAIYDLRKKTKLSKVIFFAGGGTNGTFDNYSAYCIGKIALIKMTELLDSECPELQVSIIGTGWINTKIHQQTLSAGRNAGINFGKTQEFMNRNNGDATTLETIASCIDWCLSAPREAVGGRNFSLVHDQWRDAIFIEQLTANPNSHKLRRLT
jgi:NAD(P)-dependent dehydrogenase (short-subunit alcohol dehydrogenase family)